MDFGVDPGVALSWPGFGFKYRLRSTGHRILAAPEIPTPCRRLATAGEDKWTVVTGSPWMALCRRGSLVRMYLLSPQLGRRAHCGLCTIEECWARM